MNMDDIYPRNEEHRYRIYVLADGELSLLAAAPSPGGVGQAIIQFHIDQKEIGRRFDDLGRVGVLDVLPDGKPAPKGEWIVSPFDRRPR